MRRKKSAREVSHTRPLSAYEAGKISPRGRDAAPVPRSKVRYDDEESYPLEKPLTVREEEVLSLLADGKSNLDISQSEKIALKTVGKHIENIYPKLGVNTRADAAIWYMKKRLRKMEREIAQLKRQLARRSK